MTGSFTTSLQSRLKVDFHATAVTGLHQIIPKKCVFDGAVPAIKVRSCFGSSRFAPVYAQNSLVTNLSGACDHVTRCTNAPVPQRISSSSPGEREYLYKWAAMPHEGDSMLNLDYLKCLNTAQLLELLEDEERMQETVRVNSKLQHLQRCKVILMASNCWLAEQNLAHQPHLNNSKMLLAEKYQILGQMVSSMRRKQRKLETLQQKLSLRAIHKLLKKKTHHSLSQSENLWLKFTEGKLLLTDFVESLQNSQMLCHRHLIQAEKIQDLILQSQIHNQDIDFARLRHHPNFGHSPTMINVFSGVYPVLLLPGFQYPHLSPKSYLPPLKHHGCVDICSTLISKDELSGKQSFCKCTETRRRPQRHAGLQPLDKNQSNIHQTP